MAEPNLQAMSEELEKSLREVGVYVDAQHWLTPVDENADQDDSERRGVPRKSHALIVEADLGDLAFSPRVQDPQQFGIDQEFSLLTRELTAQSFQSTREEMLRQIKEGKNPFTDPGNQRDEEA